MIQNLLNNTKTKKIAESSLRGGIRGAVIAGLFVLIGRLIGIDFETYNVYKLALFGLSISLSGVIANILLNRIKK